MFTKLRLAFIIGSIAVFSAAAPVSAQLLDPNVGTGNLASCYYDQNGTLQVGIPGVGQTQLAIRHQSGASAFAEVPELRGGSYSPALTGGGSTGYNKSVLESQ